MPIIPVFFMKWPFSLEVRVLLFQGWPTSQRPKATFLKGDSLIV